MIMTPTNDLWNFSREIIKSTRSHTPLAELPDPKFPPITQVPQTSQEQSPEDNNFKLVTVQTPTGKAPSTPLAYHIGDYVQIYSASGQIWHQDGIVEEVSARNDLRVTYDKQRDDHESEKWIPYTEVPNFIKPLIKKTMRVGVGDLSGMAGMKFRVVEESGAPLLRPLTFLRKFLMEVWFILENS